MTNSQAALGSGFDARSTTDGVLTGIDLEGQFAIVTGGHSGLGLQTTRALIDAGADVLVAARDIAAANRVLGEHDRMRVEQLDLADQDSIKIFAGTVRSSDRPVDILINSAGVMACPETRVGPGWEAQFGVNHLGHFALVNRLWPQLRRGSARVVSVSSSGHHASAMRWHDVQFDTGYDRFLAYGQSKTANALFAVHLDSLGRRDGVSAFSLHPGMILTNLVRHLPRAEMQDNGWIDENGTVIDPRFKTVEQGAATQVWAATSPMLTDQGGVYCEDCDIAAPAPASGEQVGVKPWASDVQEARRLWALSAELTGIDAFGSS
ncbi:Short-chain dehydrogenase/reductase SDR [Rhodococcus sp. AW25M09]|uniref:oxidoreductase n=1 Tax=Rhodococcus sp. AW25M09 TaxID=1268303 RepID=UPI0002ACD6F1|nr:oxidoreductase [Rhodococcus sp. AW25M09]CCQ17527.1 Short-chain dehydrogenase/reductase SDR [Rhodococcus sp. AW25M09]